jgi:hypothetical protein
MANLNFTSQEDCKKILEKIVLNPATIKFRGNYGFYYAETSLNAISEVYLRLVGTDVLVTLYFAETIPQAKHFYPFVNYPQITNLRGWDFYSNLNLSYIATKLVWFKSLDDNLYFNYWKNNIQNIHQYTIQDALIFLQNLNLNSVVDFNKNKLQEFDNNFTNTERKTVNFNPSFCIEYTLDIINSDEKQFINDLKKIILQGLSILNQPQNFLIP